MGRFTGTILTYQLPYSLHHRNYRHYCAIGISRLETAVYDLVRHKGTDAIMHSYQSLISINKLKPTLHRMKARSTTIGNTVRHIESILTT